MNASCVEIEERIEKERYKLRSFFFLPFIRCFCPRTRDTNTCFFFRVYEDKRLVFLD
jgi:hypothetical protein